MMLHCVLQVLTSAYKYTSMYAQLGHSNAQKRHIAFNEQ